MTLKWFFFFLFHKQYTEVQLFIRGTSHVNKVWKPEHHVAETRLKAQKTAVAQPLLGGCDLRNPGWRRQGS